MYERARDASHIMLTTPRADACIGPSDDNAEKRRLEYRGAARRGAYAMQVLTSRMLNGQGARTCAGLLPDECRAVESGINNYSDSTRDGNYCRSDRV